MITSKTLARLIGLGAVGAAAAVTYELVIRPWHLRWGATAQESQRPLPGDELVPHPRQSSTRAITIYAPAAEIWPWLVQLGQGRGGFYSHDWLENLAGCNIHSASRVIPKYQQLAVGDRVRLGPEGYPFYTVAAIEPEQALVLRAGDPKEASPHVYDSWVFYLNEITSGLTRLIVRNRRDYTSTAANFITWRIITEPAQFVMESKMLQGIKQRAETVINNTA